MKKIIKYIFSMIALSVLLIACEKNEPIMFENENSFISFLSSARSVNEATMVEGEPVVNTLAIPVMLVTFDNSPVTVEFDFSVEGIPEEAQAHEDDAFVLLNDSKTLTFSGGLADGSTMGYDTIYIQTIDDDIFTGNRRFDIKLLSNSAGYSFGTRSSIRVTIIDDEHPLNIVLGTYSVAAVSAGGQDAPGTDLSRTITTSAVEGVLDQVSFPINQFLDRWGGPDSYLVYAHVDVDEQTFKIQVGQDFDSWGYGPVKISGYDGETGDRMEDGLFVRGTFDEDGTITLHDYIGAIITDGGNAGLSFTIWEPGSVWTKVGKKSMPFQFTDEAEPRDLILRRF